MRSVNSRKASRNGRAKPARRDTRKTTRAKPAAKASKAAPARPFGRRTEFRNDVFARFGRWLRHKLTFRRPVLYLSGTLLASVVVIGLFAGGYIRAGLDRIESGADAVSSYAGFGISKLHLAGEDRTPPQQVLAVLNFKPGQSIFDADLGLARARLMQLPWVAEAEVTRRYPDSVSVAITEKHPFALWQSTSGLFVIERSGAVITRATVKEFPKLPVFVGDPPKGGDDLVEAVSGHRAVVARLRAMQRIAHRRWNLILDDGVVVKLPEAGWKKQIDVLEHLIVDKGVLERDIQEIDLRSPDNYFFVLRGQKQPQQVSRGNAA